MLPLRIFIIFRSPEMDVLLIPILSTLWFWVHYFVFSCALDHIKLEEYISTFYKVRYILHRRIICSSYDNYKPAYNLYWPAECSQGGHKSWVKKPEWKWYKTFRYKKTKTLIFDIKQSNKIVRTLENNFWVKKFLNKIFFKKKEQLIFML